MQIIGSVNLLENAPEVISEGLNFKIFPGKHAPRPPYQEVCMVIFGHTCTSEATRGIVRLRNYLTTIIHVPIYSYKCCDSEHKCWAVS